MEKKTVKLGIVGLFRGRNGQYEVWDTSALSNHFELFKQTLQQGFQKLEQF